MKKKGEVSLYRRAGVAFGRLSPRAEKTEVKADRALIRGVRGSTTRKSKAAKKVNSRDCPASRRSTVTKLTVRDWFFPS